MALYTYRCRNCATVLTASAPAGADRPPQLCPQCNELMHRDYRVDAPQPAPVWQEHFNPSTGSLISDKKQLAAKLREKSDYMSEKTGMEHRYVPVDRADIPAFADPHDTKG